MDKLKLFSHQRAEIPRHIREEKLSYHGLQVIRPGLNITYWKGENYFVTVAPQGTFIEFNPTRYLTQQNLKMINRCQLRESVNQLSEELQTDFNDWQVSIFDININVVCEHPPTFYMGSFGMLKGWTVREYFRGGKNYTTSSNSKALTIYDKLKRMNLEGDPIPVDHLGQNIMRIELSINKQPHLINELKNMKTIRDYTILENYIKLPKLLLKHYKQIEQNENLEVIPGLKKNEQAWLIALKTHTISGYKEKIRIEYANNFRHHLNKIDELVEKVIEHRRNVNFISDLQILNTQVNYAIESLIQSAH